MSVRIIFVFENVLVRSADLLTLHACGHDAFAGVTVSCHLSVVDSTLVALMLVYAHDGHNGRQNR